ncbi:MAG: ABC transporter permease subunit [Gammaproteobacteria bacterium]|nr:ABC transporter permease subunit [Gammaproteobacteria bacterium]
MNLRRHLPLFLVPLALLAGGSLVAQQAAPANLDLQPTVRIGSKAFTESHILAEMAAQLLESEGYRIERKLGLGGTLIAYQALQEGAIDLYPEYTGTISQVILQQDRLSSRDLVQALAQKQLQLLPAFGFNNSYAIAISQILAEANNISKISELANWPTLRPGFSLEFLNRADGWLALQKAYQLPQRASGLEHALAYAAVASGQLDITDAYTTDGELDAFSLTLLEDDRQFFPRYDAVLLARSDLAENARAILVRLAGKIDEQTMRRLNASISGEQLRPAQVANRYLQQQQLLPGTGVHSVSEPQFAPTLSQRIWRNTLVHLKLTGLALLFACLVAIPTALLLFQHQGIARGILYTTGLIQTIPALALLALLIPVFGLGELPAIIALFLYSLLPIVRNTLTGIFGVDPLLKQVAAGMGLTPGQQLRKIELPLAIPMILAGIKTAAIISIGTATLAAFVGAGGLGEPIISGLTLNDHALILEGAIPAAMLAIVAELIFEGIERLIVPRHLLN